MATTYTTNYNLGKQENHADKFDMDVITDNADKIDAALAAKADKSTTYTKTEVDTALSSKQNTISDLSTIRSGAALGATAVQPVSGKGLSTNDYTNDEKSKLAGIEAQANKTTVDSALSGTSTNPVQNKVVKAALDGKQATLTTAQLAAVNSGITAEKLTQDENNISWNTNNGVKNLLNFDADAMKSVNTGGTWSGNTWTLDNNVTLTINSDKSVTLNGTANAGKVVYLAKNLGMAEKAYTLSTGALTTKLWAGIIEVGGTENNYTGATTHIDKTCQPNHITLYIESGCTLSNFTIYPMLTLKSLYDADPSYQSYALSNAELTAEIADIIDSTYGTAHNVDLDTLTKGGRYLVNGAESSTSNAPFANWQTVEVYESNLDGYTTLTVQIATELGAGLTRKFRRRTYSGGGQYSAWTAWTS